MVEGNQLNVVLAQGTLLETYVDVFSLPDDQRSVGVCFAEPTILHSESLLHASGLKFNPRGLKHVLS